DTPVTTRSSPVGISSERFLRLFWRAPRMTIADSERRCNMPLFYRRAHPFARRRDDFYFLVAEELVGMDSVLRGSSAEQHFLHRLDQPRRAGDVIDAG